MPAISCVRLHLLGRFAAVPASAPDKPVSISSRKGCALLAYVAMQPEPTQTREQLATLLWGDRFDTQARQSLRQCLLSLRRDLHHAVPDLLALDGELVGLNVQAFSTDAHEFAALAEEGGDPERALGLYRGEFLAGFSLDVEPFDEWVRGERARFAAIAARLLESQAEESDARGHGEQALRACERLLAIDPLREDWQRLALRLTARHRGRDQALAQAKTLTALLRRELDAAPESATAALIEEIRRGAIAPASQTRRPEPVPPVPPDADGAVAAVRAPLAPARAADAVDLRSTAVARSAPEPAAAMLDWRSRFRLTWPLAVLACVVALAILVSRLWLLAPNQSVSASAVRAGEPTVDVLLAKGWAAMNRGYTLENLTEAMDLFKEVHKRDPNLLPPMIGIAAVSINLADAFFVADTAPHLELAEAILQKALRIKADSASTHHYLGRLASARGDDATAMREYATALELNPDFTVALAQIGLTLVRTGRASEGLAKIRQAIEFRPHGNFVGYWYVMAGAAELELGRTEAALEWLLRARAVLPSGSANLHCTLAATYALRGENANAAKHVAEFRRIVREARVANDAERCAKRQHEGFKRLRQGFSLALKLSNAGKRP